VLSGPDQYVECLVLRVYGHIGDCVVATAVMVEPVSTPKFPANREKNRKFFNFGMARGSEVGIRPIIQLT
jgi:hypothetical protein